VPCGLLPKDPSNLVCVPEGKLEDCPITGIAIRQEDGISKQNIVLSRDTALSKLVVDFGLMLHPCDLLAKIHPAEKKNTLNCL